ncbi:hypothetical protein [Mucilaginibacter pedocola]|uniref:Uncharacterized protein n=1 Tax=Mucilaginibacter pedocola TaxID=1792845 RepID=A0A1S9PEV8_9SPHI|nr:hypothetical protein [Mucilaginibacter pedocola]OOQ59491.1 hypothetical protein BC343_04745 [Mucilaginibacter pedocola]
MKKFLLYIVVFSALTLLFVFILNRNYFPAKAKGNDGYVGAIVDKHAYADKTKSPRIIFCGGSSTAFGVDSKMVEQRTGLPTVNMGLNGSLGLEFILNQARYIARPSDIIILSVEYNLSTEGSYKFKKEAARLYPPAANFFSRTISQQLNDFFIFDFQHNFKTTYTNLTGGKLPEFPKNVVYSRSSFNENGDIVRNFDPHPSHDFLEKFELPHIPNADIDPMNSFKAFADEHNIKVYFVYPPLDDKAYEAKKRVVGIIQREYEDGLRIPMLDNAADAILPDSLFYDTEYHLTMAGKKVRTERLLELFKKKGVVAVK